MRIIIRRPAAGIIAETTGAVVSTRSAGCDMPISMPERERAGKGAPTW